MEDKPYIENIISAYYRVGQLIMNALYEELAKVKEQKPETYLQSKFMGKFSWSDNNTSTFCL